MQATALALIHVGLGEKDQAFEWLERGLAAREPSLTKLRVHPAYDALRGDPRFEAMVRRVGLAD